MIFLQISIWIHTLPIDHIHRASLFWFLISKPPPIWKCCTESYNRIMLHRINVPRRCIMKIRTLEYTWTSFFPRICSYQNLEISEWLENQFKSINEKRWCCHIFSKKQAKSHQYFHDIVHGLNGLIPLFCSSSPWQCCRLHYPHRSTYHECK